MLIDCFTFMNEMELLTLRLNYLNPIIDRFVLVEATTTHSGNPKPLFYHDMKHQFKEFQSKIVHVIVNDMPQVINGDRWKLENYQRNAILNGLIGMEDDDYILIGDVDEIPHIDQVAKKPFGVYDQKTFMYYFNVQSEEHWNGTVGMNYNVFRDRFKSPQQVRNNRNGLEPIRNGGWHFGWLGDYDRIMYKIKSFAHTEIDVPEYIDPLRETIQDIKPLWCPNGGPMKVCTIDDTFPSYLKDNQELFEGLIYGN